MEDYKNIVGERLKYLRKKNNYPVKKITDFLNMPRSTYSGYELGRRSPKGDTLVKLAELFDTTVDFITGKTDDDSPNLFGSKQDNVPIEKILENKSFTYKGRKLTEEEETLIANLIKTVLDNKK